MQSAITQLLAARRVFEPAKHLGLAEWSIRYVFNEQKRAFDHLAFPHIIAVGGPMDAFDAHWVREVVLQWASRLGKTFTTFCALMQECDLRPAHMMAAGPQMDLAISNAVRIRKMLEQIPHLAKQIPSKTKQARLDFGANVIHAAWARSPATLSDRNIQFGTANEFDLFEHLETKDAPDPEKMFVDRFKDNWTTRKIGFESIPLIKGKSRVERRRLTGSDCRFWVPCQHCGTYQVLLSDLCSLDGYHCYRCHCLNEEQHRPKMIRSGVWVPDGCEVNSEKAQQTANERSVALNELVALPVGDVRCVALRKTVAWGGWSETDYLVGNPRRDNQVASYQLSSLYALKLTWSEYQAQNDGSQNFVNQWEGETFEIEQDEEYDLEEEASQLASRVHVTADELPPWSKYVTLACDRQLKDYPWCLVAWSADLTQLRMLDAGRASVLDELKVIAEAAKPNVLGIDSGGFDVETVYDFVLRLRRNGINRSYPVKGASAALDLDYQLNRVDAKKRGTRKYTKLRLCMVNTASTQTWVDGILHSMEFSKILSDDLTSILAELLNDEPRQGRRAASNTWERRDRSVPNDFRDCLRYSYCMAQIARKRVGKAGLQSEIPQPQTTSKQGAREFQLVGPGNIESIVKALNR